MTRRTYWIASLLALIALAACQPAPDLSETPADTAPPPTDTLAPTATVPLTATPTPKPTLTPTPTPGPGLDELLGTPGAHYLNAELEEAAAAYADLADLYPHRAEPWLGLAGIAEREGQPEEALGYLEEATTHEPASFEAWRQYAVLLEQLERYDEARTAYGAMIGLVPSNADLYAARAMAAARIGETQAAVADLNTAASIDPYRESVWVNVAGAAYGARSYEAAAEISGAGLAVHPDSVSLHVQRGLALLSMDAADAALQDFEAAVAANEDSFQAQRGLGMALAAVGRDEDAITAYRKAGALGAFAGAIGGDGPYEALSQAAGLMARQDSRAAFDFLADQVIRYGQPPPLLYGYALIEYESGDPAAALSRLDSLIALHSYAEAYYLRGRIHAEDGDAADAREDLEYYLSVRPAGPTAEQAYALLEGL